MHSAGSLYPSRVAHQRLFPLRYRFWYRVFYVLLDVDRLPELHRSLRLFSHNRFNLVSFHDRDHGAEPGGLRRWVDTTLSARGIDLHGGRIRLLALPRILGHVFNPVSLFYCEHQDGRLRAVIAEVRNTFGERHCYVLDARGAPLPWNGPHDKDKCFHVSPFMDLCGRYRFRFTAPGERHRVVIEEYRDGDRMMVATLAGRRRALTDTNLLAAVLRMPWMTLKVVAAIHWQALKIWLRGGRFHRKPAPPPEPVS